MFSHSDRYDNSAGWQQVLISTEGGPLVVGHIRRGLSGVNQCRIHSDPSIINYFPPVINFFCQDILVQIYGNILAKVTFV